MYICMIQASKANTCWLQLPHKYKTTQAWDRHHNNQQFPKIPKNTHSTASAMLEDRLTDGKRPERICWPPCQ